jgi:hypothetical protein
MNQKISTGFAIAVIILIATFFGFIFWFVDKQTNEAADNIPLSNQRACTEEAKICPDGSAVGRTGANCEFAACPEEKNCAKEGESIGAVYPGVVPKKCCKGLTSIIPENIVGTQGICTKTTDETANWQTYVNSRVKYSFEYPTKGLTSNLNETIKYPSLSSGDSKQEDLVQFIANKISYSVETTVGVKNKTIELWIQDSNISHIDPDLAKYNKETIGGQTAYLKKDYAAAFILVDGNIYSIVAREGIAPTSDTNNPIFKHILSTFKFTK